LSDTILHFLDMVIRLLLLAIFVIACSGENCRRFGERCWANSDCCPDYESQEAVKRYRLDCNEDGKCYTSTNPPVPCFKIALFRIKAFWRKDTQDMDKGATCDVTHGYTECDYDLGISLCDETKKKCGPVVFIHGPNDTTDWKPKNEVHQICAPSMEEFKNWEWIKFDLWDRDPGGHNSWGDKDDILATSWHKIGGYGVQHLAEGRCAENSSECTDTEITFSNAGCARGMALADPVANQEEIDSNVCVPEGVPNGWPKNLIEPVF